MPAPTQLSLALAHTPSHRREDFVAGPSNVAALRMIERWPDWPSPLVLLSGPTGSGKTHLVHIWAAQSGAEIVRARDLAEERVPSIEAAGAVAIEDVDGEAVPQQVLFHLINRVGEGGGSLLLTSRDPSDAWKVSLPDLRSRLRLAAPVALGPPDDALLRTVLVKLFTDRQLLVEKPVIDYLLSRMERSLSAAIALVEALDGEALAAGRRITRPMAAGILVDSAESPDEFADRQ